MFGKGGSGGAAGSAGGDDFQQLLATIRAARDEKTRMEILRANVARAGRNVANYRAIVDLFGDAGDRANVATILVAAHQAEGAEAASLRASLLSFNITPAVGGGSSGSSSSSTFARRRREESGGGDNASQALATVGSGSLPGTVQSAAGGALGSPMDLSSSGSEGEGEGSGHGARSLGGSTLNSQEVEEAEEADAMLSLDAAPSPLFGPAGGASGHGGARGGGGSVGPGVVGTGGHAAAPSGGNTAATAAVAGMGVAPVASASPASASIPARGSMPPPLTIPSAAAAAAATSSSSSSHVAGSAPIGISVSGGGAAEEINSLVVVGSVATTISSYDSVGSLSTIESSASAEVTSHRGAGRQPFTARSSLLKPVAEPNNG